MQSGTREPTTQTPRQIYAPTPPAFASSGFPPPGTFSSSTRDSVAHTPRQIYAPTPPALSHPTLGGPVIPPSSNRPSIYRASNVTPGSFAQALPPGSLTPRGGYANIYANPDDDDDDLSPETRRNTEVNSTLGALPIPPPSFRRR